MILSQPEIRECVAKGEIRFDPQLEDRQWHEASVDLRLGFKFAKLEAKRGLKVSLAHGLSAIADAGLWREKILKRKDELGKIETYTVDQGEFVLAQTYERIWIPRNLIAAIEGRSSYARAGLSMHQTAPWLQPGWNGQVTLEICNNGPLSIELIPTCRIIDRHCERSEAIQSPCRGLWIASSASPPRNDESMILQVGITPTEDMPCQVTFFQLTSELVEALAYGARSTDVFQGQASPLPAGDRR